MTSRMVGALLLSGPLVVGVLVAGRIMPTTKDDGGLRRLAFLLVSFVVAGAVFGVVAGLAFVTGGWRLWLALT